MLIRLLILLFFCSLNVQHAMAHDSPFNHKHYEHLPVVQSFKYQNSQEIITHAENNPNEFWGHANLKRAITVIEQSDNIDLDKALKDQISEGYSNELITHLLVREGANVNQMTEYSKIGSKEIKTKSLFDIIYKSEDLYYLFLDNGLDIRAIDKTDKPFLFSQMQYIVSMYERNPMFPYEKDINDVRLRIASAIVKGADVNAKGNDFHATALMQLVAHAMNDLYGFGYEEIVIIAKLLVDYGADINITNDDGYTAWDIFRCYTDRYELQADSKYQEPHKKAIILFQKHLKPARTRPLSELKCRENVHKLHNVKYLKDRDYINVKY